MNKLPLLLLAASLSAQVPGSSRLLKRTEAYTGIASIRADSVCTAAFVRQPNATSASPAYILSNGHCLGFLRTNDVIVNTARTGTATFLKFTDTTPTTVPLKRTAYATMKGTDLAIFELDATFGDLTARGLTPLEISTDPIAANEPVSVIGHPVTGIPQDEQFLRQSDCIVTRPATNLIEFNWTWYDFLRTDCADIKPGSSGSPVISRRTGRIIGIINTTTQDAPQLGPGFDCYLGAPCELTPTGPVTIPEASYALPAAGIQSCFDNTGAFSLAAPNCPLDPGRQLTLTGLPQRTIQPGKTWNTTLSGSGFTQYRYKIIPESAGDCRQPDSYGPPQPIANKIDDPLPTREGGVFLCVIAVTGDVWQNPRHATMAHTRVDTSPSIVPPVVLIEDEGPDLRIDFRFVIPELSSYRYKFGPADTTDCNDPEGYTFYRRFPFRVPKAPSLRFCALGEDNAGNVTPPYDQLLHGPRIVRNGIVSPTNFRPSPLAPGSLATVFGVNFGGAKLDLSITDASGHRTQPEVLFQGQDQINLLLPANLTPGPATLSIGPDQAPFTIAATAPQIFILGPPAPTRLPAELNLYITGRNGATPDVRISGIPVPVRDLTALLPGVEHLRIAIPADLPVRGYVYISVNGSAPIYLWLKSI